MSPLELGDFSPEYVATLNDETFWQLLGHQQAWLESNAAMSSLVRVELAKLALLEIEADRRRARQVA